MARRCQAHLWVVSCPLARQRDGPAKCLPRQRQVGGMDRQGVGVHGTTTFTSFLLPQAWQERV